MNTILTVGKHPKTFTVKRHKHNNWELIFCTKGSGTCTFDNKELNYTKNDLIIIAPNIPHSNNSPLGFTNIHITMDNIPLSIEDAIIISDTSNKVFSQCFSQIHYFYNCDIKTKDIILQNFGELLTNFLVTYSDIERHSPIIEKLRNIIVKNFSEYSFDINTLFAEETSFNTNYLKKLFKKEVGMSPQQYLINLRLSDAKKILMNTSENNFSVSQTAYACGYQDSLYFSRAFKKETGLSPKDFYAEVCKNK